MNIQDPHLSLDTNSQISDSYQPTALGSSFLHVIGKVLPELQPHLNQDIYDQLHATMAHKTEISEEFIIETFERIIGLLVHQVRGLESCLERDVVKQDYEILEEQLQKVEAENRKHIKIEQQLKLYSETVEENFQKAQGKLAQNQRQIKELEQVVKDKTQALDQNQKQRDMLRAKVEKIEQRLYSVSRERNLSHEKRSQEFFGTNKASGHVKEKERTKVEPYLHSYSKSKPLLSRVKDKSRHLKASILLSFESIHHKDHRQVSLDKPSEERKESMSGMYPDNSYKSNKQSYSELGASIHATDASKRRKRTYTKLRTETGERREIRSNLLCL